MARTQQGILALLVAFTVVSTDVSLANVTSTFDFGSENWTVREIYDDGTITGLWGVSWTSSGGVPDGAIYTNDVGVGATAFSAPTEFLGNKTSYLGEAISFDMKNNVANAGGTERWNLLIEGSGIKIVHRDYVLSTPNQWGHFSARLTPDNWTRIVSETNWYEPITAAEFNSVLSGIDGLYIGADRGWGADISTLDNVQISSCSQVPSPSAISLVSFGVIWIARARKKWWGK